MKEVDLLKSPGMCTCFWGKERAFCDKDQNLRILPQVFFDYISVIPLPRAFRAQPKTSKTVTDEQKMAGLTACKRTLILKPVLINHPYIVHGPQKPM
jgi:hypothetical protein